MRKMMLKKIFICFALVLFYANGNGQTVAVTETKALTGTQDGEFCFPQMNRQGGKVFFSTPNYVGLYEYDLAQGRLSVLNTEMGAGYHYSINSEGTEGVYRTYEISNGRRYFSLIKQDFKSLKKTVLEKSQRDLTPAAYVNEQTIAYAKNNALQARQLKPSLNKSGSPAEPLFVCIENKKIALFDDKGKKVLEPRGTGSYIWPEISPDGQKLLFKKPGDGCYVSDLQGNVLSSLGNINAPHWSPDGKWVVYMDDRDDGYRLLASEIHIKNIETKEDIQLTDSKERIEIYPQWGADINTIVFATAKGQIYLMQLKWK